MMGLSTVNLMLGILLCFKIVNYLLLQIDIDIDILFNVP